MRRLNKERVRRIEAATADSSEHAKDRLEQALAYTADTRKSERKQHNLCRSCFYFPRTRFAGQAFTDWTCPLCKLPQRHHNTCVPCYCPTCARAYKLCVHCGGRDE